MSASTTPAAPRLPARPGEDITEIDHFAADGRDWPAAVALVSYDGRPPKIRLAVFVRRETWRHLDIQPSTLRALRRGIDEALAECERIER